VLVLLFLKYVSDKYAHLPYAPITVPEGASFRDMAALKGKSDIGDWINKKIIGPLANANKLSDLPDFNDPNKLGHGKEMVDRLTNLIAVFEDKALDFSRNRAEGDDILGDAYEYLIRHFATESGKSKGQFYTPAEVSRVIAQIIGIRGARTTNDTTVYDPTCGSGSLLLKVKPSCARHAWSGKKRSRRKRPNSNAAGSRRRNGPHAGKSKNLLPMNPFCSTPMGSNLQTVQATWNPGRNYPRTGPKTSTPLPRYTTRKGKQGTPNPRIDPISARVNIHTTADPCYSLPFGFHLPN